MPVLHAHSYIYSGNLPVGQHVREEASTTGNRLREGGQPAPGGEW